VYAYLLHKPFLVSFKWSYDGFSGEYACEMCCESVVLAQIEDLSQQAQMAAAEKFKAPEQPAVTGEIPTATVEPLHESDDEEVTVTSVQIQPIVDAYSWFSVAVTRWT